MKITTEAVRKYIEARAKSNDDRGDMHQDCAYKLGVAWAVIESMLNSPDYSAHIRRELEKIQEADKSPAAA